MKLFRIIYYKFLAKRLIKKYTYPREKYEDRDVLERIIFPYILGHLNPKKILDVGREDYEKFYNLYFKHKEFWTIDNDPAQKKFGAKNHIIDDVINIKKYFSDNYFDLIIINGVFGWGLNEENKVQKAFMSIYEILRPEGILVFGWNDDVVPIEKISGLNKLKPYYFKPLKTDKFKCINGNHTYNFYIKKTYDHKGGSLSKSSTSSK